MKVVRDLVGRIDGAFARREGEEGPRGIILAAAVGTLLAQAGAWIGSPARLFEGSGVQVADRGALARLLSALPTSGDGAGAWCALALISFLAAILVGLVARRAGLSARPAAAAALAFSVGPTLAAAHSDPAAVGFLLAGTAWFAVLALEVRTAEQGRSGGATVAQVVAAGLALFLSGGALLPLLPTWPLLAFARQGRVAPRIRMLFTASCVLGVLLVLLGLRALPELGYGFGFLEGASPFASRSPRPAPFLAATLLALLGVGAELPFLTPGRWWPELAALVAGGLVFVWMLVPTPADRVRRLALRLGSSTVLFGALAALLVAGTTSASAVGLAVLIPAWAGVCWTLAGLLEPRTRLSKVMQRSWRPAFGLALALPFVVWQSVQAQRILVRGGDDWIEDAQQADPGFPLSALALSGRAQQRSGRPDPGPLRAMILRAHPPLLPRKLETEQGLRALRDLENDVGVDAAWDWYLEWRAHRVPGRGLDDAARVQGLRLQILRDEVDAALGLLEEHRQQHPEPEYASFAARAVLDAMERRRDEPALVDRLLPVAEQLLERAGEARGTVGVDALLTLADLRAAETRFIDAVRAAEAAATRDPEDPRPLLLQARIYLGLGQREDGLAKVQAAAALDPDHPGVEFLQGRLWTTVPQLARRGAEAMVEAYLRDPERAGDLDEVVGGVLEASQLLRAEGRLDEALAVLDAAAGALPVRAALAVEKARVLKLRKDWAGAAKLLDEALARDPGDEVARVELAQLLRDEGFLLLLAGGREHAVLRFERALELNAPGVAPDAMQAVVESFRREAAPPAQRVLRAQQAFERGLRAYSEGDDEAARAALEESLERLPDNPLARLNLGRLELEAGHLAQAEEQLRTAIDSGERQRFDIEHAYLLLARTLLASDQLDELRGVAERYRELHPSGPYREQIDALCGGG